MNIAVLQHVPFEGPASIVDWANSRGHCLRYCNLYSGDDLPSLSSFDFLLVLGGPMGVQDEAGFPWLVAEKAFIRSVIDSGKKILGICLGAQLVADVLGAAVTRHSHREIGWFPLQRTGSHDLGKHLDGVKAFHWHGDAFALPSGAEHLACSEGCANQAFIYHDKVLGLQFHLEFTPEVAKRLIEHCADEVDGGPYTQTAEQILSMPMRFAKIHQALYRLLDDWLESSPQ